MAQPTDNIVISTDVHRPATVHFTSTSGDGERASSLQRSNDSPINQDPPSPVNPVSNYFLSSSTLKRTSKTGRSALPQEFSSHDEYIKYLHRSIKDSIESAFLARNRDETYYFWTMHLRSIERFIQSAYMKDLQERYFSYAEPFLRAIKHAKKLWDKIQDTQKLNDRAQYEPQLFDAEVKLAMSLCSLLDKVLPGAAHREHPWEPTNFLVARRAEARSRGDAPRAEDVLFWPRFLGEMNDMVPVKDFIEALFLQLKIVEKQAIPVASQENFQKITLACLGLNPEDNFGRLKPTSEKPISWCRFIKLFGPNLDRLFARMCGVVNPRDLTLCSWLNYHFTQEDCENYLEENQGESSIDFILRVSRDRENFVIHYWVEQTNDDDTTSNNQVQSKIYLTRAGYQRTEGDKNAPINSTRYNTLRDFLLFYVCQEERDCAYMANQLDKEKLEWDRIFQAEKKTRSAHQHNSLAIEESTLELMPELSKCLKFEDATLPLAGEIGTFLERRGNDDVYECVEIVYNYLKREMGENMIRTENLQLGVFMILRDLLPTMLPPAAEKGQEYHREFRLIEMIPRQLVNLSLKGFHNVIAGTAAHLYVASDRNSQNQKDKEDFLKRLQISLRKLSSELRVVYNKELSSNKDMKEGYSAGNGEHEEDNLLTQQWRTDCWGAFSFRYSTLWAVLNVVRITLFLPLVVALQVFFPQGLRTVFMMATERDLCFRINCTIILSAILIFLYYSPIVSVIFYQKYLHEIANLVRPKSQQISGFEAWTPFVSVVILGFVVALSHSSHVYQRKVLAQRWYQAQMMLEGCISGDLDPVEVTDCREEPSDSKFYGFSWFLKHNQIPDVSSNDLVVFRVGWTYFTGRKWYLLIVVILSIVHALIPLIFRCASNRHLPCYQVAFGTQWYEKFIGVVHLIVSCIGMGTIMFFLEGAAMHYLQIRGWMTRVISLTDVKTARIMGCKYALPLTTAENFSYWALLRSAGKQQVDPVVTGLLAVNLVLDISTILAVFLRVVIHRTELFDLWDLLGVFDFLVLTGFLTQIFAVVLSLNKQVLNETVSCLQQAKIVLARRKNETHKKLSVAKVEEENVRARTNEQDFDDLEELKAKTSIIKSLEQELQDQYCCSMMIESTLTSMNSLDLPITVLGISVDTNFMVKLVAVAGSGIVSVCVAVAKNYLNGSKIH